MNIRSSGRPPTIVATSGGMRVGELTTWQPAPLLWHQLALTGARRPKLAALNTAVGDQRAVNAHVHEAFYGTDVEVTCVNLLPMPNFADLREHLASRDAIWVNGGSVAALAELWRIHGLGEILRDCWQAGVVLGGVSAGSLCWHVGGTTDSFGPLRPFTAGLALLPYSNGVHYDSESERRPLYHRLVADGTLPDGYATDNGVGLVYHGTELAEVVGEKDDAAGYHVTRQADGTVTETRLEPRRLPEP